MQSGPLSETDWKQFYNIEDMLLLSLFQIDKTIDAIAINIDTKHNYRKEFASIFKRLVYFYRAILEKLPDNLNLSWQQIVGLRQFCNVLNISFGKEQIQEIKDIYTNLQLGAEFSCELLSEEDEWDPVLVRIGLSFINHSMCYSQNARLSERKKDLFAAEKYIYFKLINITKLFLSKELKIIFKNAHIESIDELYSLVLKRRKIVEACLKKINKKVLHQSEEKLEIIKRMIKIIPELTLPETLLLDEDGLKRAEMVVEKILFFVKKSYELDFFLKEDELSAEKIKALLNQFSFRDQESYVKGLFNRLYGSGRVYPRELQALLYSIEMGIKKVRQSGSGAIPKIDEIEEAIGDYLMPTFPLGMPLDREFLNQFCYFLEVINCVPNAPEAELISSMNANAMKI